MKSDFWGLLFLYLKQENPIKMCIINFYWIAFKVSGTSGPVFEKIMKGYPIFYVQIIYYKIDQMHK